MKNNRVFYLKVILLMVIPCKIGICLLLICPLSVIVQAAYTTLETVSYKSGYCYHSFSNVTHVLKTTNSETFRIYTSDKTSWTSPYGAIAVDPANDASYEVSGEYTLITGTIQKSFLPLYQNQYHNVILKGKASQFGTDTMSIKYDVDY